MTNPYTGVCDPSDIRTFYTSELAYLRAITKRYACANCGTSSRECSSCERARLRIEHLEAIARHQEYEAPGLDCGEPCSVYPFCPCDGGG